MLSAARMMRRLVYACLLAAGCSHDGPLDGTLSDGGAADLPAMADLAGADLGPFACGSGTCTASQVCIVPCCGGAGNQCDPPPDGGWMSQDQCGQGQQWGFCVLMGIGVQGCYSPCVPPPSFCKDIPAGCDTSTLCSQKVDQKCSGLGGWMGEPCTLDGARIVSHCI